MRRDELLNWMPHIEVVCLSATRMLVSRATEMLQRDEETIAALEAEHDQLRAELAECKRDAERYRWLRGDAPDHSGRWTQWEVRRWKAPMWTQDLRRDELDAAIDAAMKNEAGKEETK